MSDDTPRFSAESERFLKRLASPWILAPMAGVSEATFRGIAFECGAGGCPTELVSCRGILQQSTRAQRYLARDPAEPFFWVQIFGGDPTIVCKAAAALRELQADIVDINMGCPVRKVTRKGGGSALLLDPTQAAEVVAAAKEGFGGLVTAKIRLGWGDGVPFDGPAFVEALAQAGACAVGVHARTRTQGYTGQADWSSLHSLVKQSSVPILGNGDAFTPGRAREMLSQTGCAAVMIGRGALGNPWIFDMLRAQNTPAEAPAGPQRWPIIARHFEATLHLYARPIDGVRKFRQHWRWYAAYFEGSDIFMEAQLRDDDPDSVRARAADFFQNPGEVKDPESIYFESKRALG